MIVRNKNASLKNIHIKILKESKKKTKIGKETIKSFNYFVLNLSGLLNVKLRKVQKNKH